MPDRPAELNRLFASAASGDREVAWASLVRTHSDLLLRTARFFGGDHDAVMDRYAFILEQLQRDDFHRLRSYQPDDRATFDIWLVAVARRLCLDHHRHRYGRVSSSTDQDQRAAAARSGRRRLVDLVGESLEVGAIVDETGASPEEDLARRELAAALGDAIAALDHRDRLLLRLLFEEDLPAREVAGLLGFPTLFHVYRRRNQVLSQLRQALETRGVGGPEP